MYSIQNSVNNTIVIKKSKFITKLYKINNIDEITYILDNLKKEYNDSTHICYGYIVDNIERCFDDGEPSGTAGMPILNVLKKNNLNYILAVVIRYFGGIKLGSGGLIRAYSNSIIEALKLTEIVIVEEGYIIELTFNYEDKKQIENILKNYKILSKSFEQIILYTVEIKISDIKLLEKELKSNTKINIKKRILIES